jgi:flavin reductase (DIM6/NTAB) family NADH-FMN oxidoreductase RutF
VIIDSTVEPVLPLLRAVGKIPSGIFVLTTGHGPDVAAMLVSFVQQLSREPLCIGVALHQARKIAPIIEKSRGFTLNICQAGDKTLMRKYARQAQTGEEAFADVRTRRLENGAIIMLDACAYIWCDYQKRVEFGADHDLFIGTATLGDLLGEDNARPVVHIRHDGSNY